MSQKYIADILPLNTEKIGHATHGKAEFEVTTDTLIIRIQMHDTPANTQHWEHFHGFQDIAEMPSRQPVPRMPIMMVLSICQRPEQYQEQRWCHLMQHHTV